MWQSKPPVGIQLNKQHPLAQGLVGCWLFNEGAGLRVNDLSGNSNHGILTNFEPMSATSGWTGGNTGTSLIFNGINNFIDCGNNPSLNLNTLTIMTNLNFQTPIDINGRIISKNASEYDLSISNANLLSFALITTSSGTKSRSVTLIPNTEYNIAATFNGTTQNIYINGTLNQTQTFIFDTLTQTTNNVVIGDLLSGLRSYSGKIHNIFLWNRSLNLTEIQQLYTQLYSIFYNHINNI